MRLLIDVREGDWATFHGRYGNRTAWRLGRMESFGPSSSRGADDTSARWHELYDATLGQAFEISVPPSTTVSDCLAHALREARRRGVAEPETEPPADGADRFWGDRVLRTWLADPVTDERHEDGLTLERAGLTEDDLVVLCVERTARGAYSMGPAANPAVLLERLQLAMNGTAPAAGPRLWGVLLYTTADVELATYVRTHFEDLNALSGPNTRVFVVERQARWTEARKYWRAHLEPELYRMLSSMRWLHWQPYDPQGAYKIAAVLKVDPELLPCLVFFDSRPGLPWGERRIVFPVEDVTPRYFRTLFGRIAKALESAPPEGEPPPDGRHGPLSFESLRDSERSDDRTVLRALLNSGRDGDRAAFAAVEAAQRAIREALRPAPAPSTGYHLDNCRVILTPGASVTENFHFHGQNTTFINRPVDTVVQDFQNQHGTAPCHEELRSLLRLTLSSTDLADAERDEAAAAVHDLARLTAEPEPDAPGVRLRAERLREMLAGAADIAQPALAIIASVVAAVTG
ncbi:MULTISPECIES: hypothetical protein [unclassified Streptomyces]|uniref:hypothetical protein n=1 Tax=unclassified Streptomyces TaxID=2593676 RepID=UPI0009677729|nr:hypothetical protein [Streptomyces sp. TSRI0281]OKI48117.1 hypothetical protein A6A29_03430 [Streptomyces sp. TSRI0281]